MIFEQPFLNNFWYNLVNLSFHWLKHNKEKKEEKE